MKTLLKEYFLFSKSQQRAILFLVVLIVLLLLIYFFLPFLVRQESTVVNNELKEMMAQIKINSDQSHGSYFSKKDSYQIIQLTPFAFNPNTLDEAGFKRLGLRPKLVSTLLNYRNKGGKFYNKESLKRIYGLHENEYQQLEPFIEIPNEYKHNLNNTRKENLSIELNTADTSQLIKLRGIGSKLSMNIIKRREQLGGFADVEQLKEVYGISEETFLSIGTDIHVNAALVRKLNLNEATLYELNAHPYLRGELARALVDFRKTKNYKIEDLNQIKEIPLINEEIFRKIVPYLSIK